jgi:hypothetical protein
MYSLDFSRLCQTISTTNTRSPIAKLLNGEEKRKMLAADFHSVIRISEVASIARKSGMEFRPKIDLGIQKTDKTRSTHIAHIWLLRLECPNNQMILTNIYFCKHSFDKAKIYYL